MRFMLVLVALSLALSGCKKDLNKIVRDAEKEFGVSILLQTDQNDKCAVAQMELLWDEYNSLSDPDRASFRALLQQKYKSVVINHTVNSMVVSGESLQLAYVVKGHVLASKTLVDNRTRGGTEPQTQLDKKDVLTITTQQAVMTDESTVYAVSDPDLFNFVQNKADLDKLTTKVLLNKPRDVPGFECGNRFADLRSLL